MKELPKHSLTRSMTHKFRCCVPFLTQVAIKKVPYEIPDGLPPALSSLIRLCLDYNPMLRPCATQVIDALQQLMIERPVEGTAGM